MHSDTLQTGLVSVEYDRVQPAGAMSYTPAQKKRKLNETGFEVPDSEDEYGWGEEDASALPGQPPQWQGSEDIILGTHTDTEDDDNSHVDDHKSDPTPKENLSRTEPHCPGHV